MIKARYAPIFVLYSSYFLDVFGMAVAFPMFAALINDPSFGGIFAGIPFQYRSFFIPLLTAVFPLMQVLWGPYFARLGARYGRKYLLNATLFLLAISFGLTAISIFLKSFIFLFLSRLLSGIFAANYILSVIPAEISDGRTIHLYHKKLFQVGASGLVLGILTGGILSDNNINAAFQSYTPFVFTAFYSLMLLCISTYSLTSNPAFDPWAKELNLFSWKGFKKIVFQKKSLPFLIFFLFQFAWLSNLQYFPVYITKLFGPHKIFITFILMGMTIACLTGLYLLSPSLCRVLGRKPFLQFSLAGAFFFHLLSILTNNLFATTFFHIIFALYVGLIWSCISLYITASTLQAEYELVAYKIMAFLIAAVLAALIAGLLTTISIHLVYLFGCTCLLFAIIFSFLL